MTPVPETVTVQEAPLTGQQQRAVDSAWSELDVRQAIDLDVELTNISSYTGFEREINEFTVDRWRKLGIDAAYQSMDASQGNAIAQLHGDGSGPTLLLVGPIDTHWTGRQEDDGLQWGDPMRRDNRLAATVEGQTVIGLGSNNVKASATAIVLAVEAVQKANLKLKGTLVAALAAGGAPALSPPGEARRNIGHGAGVLHMLSHGVASDFALYHKPGYHVSWLDQGLNQYRVRVKSFPSYMANECDGYRTVADTARLMLAFDHWAQEYRRDNSTRAFSARAAVNAVSLGRSDKPNWSPAVAELFMDIRTAPWLSRAEAEQLFESAMKAIMSDHPGMDLEWQTLVSLPGGQTDPASWIVQSAIRGALAVDGQRSEVYTSRPAGQTEMALLAASGIPTAKVFGGPGTPGVLRSPELPEDLQEGFTMSGAYGPHIVKAAQAIAYSVIDTLTRTREEVGLD